MNLKCPTIVTTVSSETPASCRILGIRIDAVSQEETLRIVRRWIEERRPRQIATVNPEFVMRAQRDAAFAEVLEGADLNVPDGVGVVWAARRRGVWISERVGGSDIAGPLAAQCERFGHSLFLLGAAPGVAEEAGRQLRRHYPALHIVGTFAGSPDPADDDALVELVRQASPDLLWVAYGAPRQEMWISRNKERLQVPVVIGVGGTLDYLAGVHPRAPRFIQRLWLDWLFRLITQPWRFRRMLVLPQYVVAVFCEGRN